MTAAATHWWFDGPPSEPLPHAAGEPAQPCRQQAPAAPQKPGQAPCCCEQPPQHSLLRLFTAGAGGGEGEGGKGAGGEGGGGGGESGQHADCDQFGSAKQSDGLQSDDTGGQQLLHDELHVMPGGAGEGGGGDGEGGGGEGEIAVVDGAVQQWMLPQPSDPPPHSAGALAQPCRQQAPWAPQ